MSFSNDNEAFKVEKKMTIKYQIDKSINTLLSTKLISILLGQQSEFFHKHLHLWRLILVYEYFYVLHIVFGSDSINMSIITSFGLWNFRENTPILQMAHSFFSERGHLWCFGSSSFVLQCYVQWYKSLCLNK